MNQCQMDAAGQSVPRRVRSMGRIRLVRTPSNKVTFVAVCRDVLFVVHAECGTEIKELKPAIDEIEMLLRDLSRSGR